MPRFRLFAPALLCALLAGAWLADAPLAAREAAAAEPVAAEQRPTLLFCTFAIPGRTLDFDYLQRLHEAGFTVDYIERWEDFTWERISQYNVLFMFGFPYEYRGVLRRPPGLPMEGPDHAETLALVKRFLGQGGGVMLNLSFLGSNRVSFGSARQTMRQFGVDLPLELVKVPPTHEARHPRLEGTPYLYTEQIADTPVSEGVTGIWWPNPQVGHVDYHRYSAPIEVDERWQVVVRASQGSRSFPFVPRGQAEIPQEKLLTDVLVRPEGVPEPPLYAIRDGVEGQGRMALFYCRPVFHVGSGLSWLHDGAMLDKGLGRQRSDFAKLLENTFRYLAAPSLASGNVGGAEVPADRVLPPVLNNEPQAFHDPAKNEAEWADLNPDKGPAPTQVYRGLVGARSTYSGGEGTVAEYAAAAREAGLDFVIFLEPLAELSKEELAQLTADCQQHSNDKVLLLPGYRVRANTGNRMMFYGAQPLYPHEKVMSARGPNLYMLQGETPEGEFTPKNVASLTFQIKDFMGKHLASVNNLGFFDFRRAEQNGGISMYHAKCFGAAAVMFYENGELVEDVKDQYLRTNAGCMTCVPLSVDLVDSPTQMKAAVAAGHALTHVQAPSLAEIVEPLSKNHQFESDPVSVSTGPQIRLWPEMTRPFIYGEEWFANGKGLVAADLHVTSEVGLTEVALYQGERLWRRFVPPNPKDFHVRLFFSGLLQNNISAIATDARGGQAICFPRHSRKAGEQQQISYCGDHVNEGFATRMARAINYWTVCRYPQIPAAGTTWDGGPKGKLPIVSFGRWSPAAFAADGTTQKYPYQYPVLQFADEGVYCGRSVLSGTTEFGGNPWRAWGPIVRPQIFDGYSQVTEFGQYTDGVDPTSWGGPGMRRGNLTFLYEQRLTFVRDTTITRFLLFHGKNETGTEALLLSGRGTNLLHASDLTPVEDKAAANRIVIPTGHWFAAATGETANCFLAFNRGAPLQLDVTSRDFDLSVPMPEGGLAVKPGDRHDIELVTLTWPLDGRLWDSDDVLAVVDYLQNPHGLEVAHGERLETAAPGVLEFAAEAGTVELRIPRPPKEALRELPDLSLAVRVRGLQPRWSAGYYQLAGFGGQRYYSNGREVYRPLGVDPEGQCAFPLYQQKARQTQVVAGHPVVAEGAGAEQLFIQVTALTGQRSKRQPMLWHVSVNNPTDAPVTATIKPNIDLPNFRLQEQTLTLAPGEYKVLLHQAEVVAAE